MISCNNNQVREIFMDSDNWGGKRIGAGRKPLDNKTVVVRIPEFLKEKVKDFVSSETTRGDSRLEQIEMIISDWRRTRPTHSPSYKNVDKLLSELEAVFPKKEI